MSCLGEKLTALVDGELDHDERDRALAHLATCAGCRTEADTLRRLKDRLRALAEPPREPVSRGEPELELPSADFLRRLYALGEQPSAPARPRLGPSGVPVPRPRPRDNRPAGHAAAHRPTRPARQVSRRRTLAVGAAAAVVLGLGTASYTIGGQREEPAVVPAFNQLEIEHALTNGLVPLTGATPGP